jgi:hypothetical protein
VIDMSGKAASKALGALERRGYDVRGKLSAPISRLSPSRSSQAKSGCLNVVSAARIMWQAASQKPDGPRAG